MNGRIAFRAMRETDKAHVYRSFVQSYRKSPYAEGMTGAFLASLLDKMLALGWAVEIACVENDEEVIAGWMLYNYATGACGYVFVKPELRRCGIARALWGRHCGMAAMKVPFLVTSPNVASIVEHRGGRLLWRPYIPFGDGFDKT